MLLYKTTHKVFDFVKSQERKNSDLIYIFIHEK